MSSDIGFKIPDLKQRLARLGQFATKFQDVGFIFAEMQGGSKIGPGVYQMPWSSLGETANQFYKQCYDDGWVVPGFDWIEWIKKPEARGLLCEPDNPSPGENLSKASPEQLAMLLTAVIRNNRGCEGFLQEAYSSGLLTSIVRRAEELAQSLDDSETSRLSEIPDSVLDRLGKATPEDVRFIKLGKKGMWWQQAEATGTLRLGFTRFDFDLCSSGKWKEAADAYGKTGERKRPSDTTRAVNQVRDFFELPDSILWFTIEGGDVWWCFAEEGVTDLRTGDDATARTTGSQSRCVIDRWRNTDVLGNRLRLDSMTTKITKVASFQETIAKPGGAVDLLRKIRGVQSEPHRRAVLVRDEMVATIGDLLDQLHQDDFELLIELIFSSSGWKRISNIGGTQKTLDMAMVLPTTGEHCFVQVKSQTSQAVFEQLVDAMENMTAYSRMFFVYHSPTKQFPSAHGDRVVVWHRYEVAKQAMRAGLVDWILDRTT